MRKIISNDERKEKEKRNKTMIGVLLALILLFSTAGYFISDLTGGKKEKIVYNNIKFESDDNGYWHFLLQGKEFIVMSNPFQVENITINAQKALGDYVGKPLYFESSSSQIGIYEISRNIGDYVERINYACLSENCSEYAIKNCSTDNVVIIKMAEGNKSFVKDNENCVSIEYASGEEGKAVDAFIFRLLGLK